MRAAERIADGARIGEMVALHTQQNVFREGWLIGIECQHIDVDSTSNLRRLVN